MSIDFDGISDAIAARYLDGVIGHPAGQTAIHAATAKLPNALTTYPMVLVFPDQGRLEVGGGTRTGAHGFLVRFYLRRLRDLQRETPALRKWLTRLLDAHLGAIQLGGLVTDCRTSGYRLDVLRYAGVDHSGIELTVDVVTTEGWSPTA